MPKCCVFCFAKNKDAEHFPKENVQQSKMLQMHLMLCKKIFLHHILFCVAKMHLMQKCILAYILLCKMFSTNKMLQMHFCVHFPKENVQRTFYFVKCSASHFPKENVQHHIFQRKMFSNQSKQQKS